MIILYYHVLPLKPYMMETKKLISEIVKDHSSKFQVIDCITGLRSNDMGKHLGKWWGTDDIMIIGQDNVPTITTLYEMKLCDFPLCVNPCVSFPASTDLNKNMLNQIDKNGKMYEYYERPKSVYYGGTGVSKISLGIQKRTKIPSFDFGFPAFDSALFNFGLRDWHCHYPIHQHTKDMIEYAHFEDSLR